MPDGGTRVAVLGATGFGGALCAHIVDRHPSLELTVATARAEAGRRHDELYPRYAVRQVLEQFDADSVAERADAALVAYPHKTAALAVKQLRERGLKVVDLSADFRLDQAAYERWYQPHEAPELLGEAVYGLPEAHREEIAAASLVAGPGCNSTAAILAALPLRGRIEDAVFDIKAGVSGAGREATEETHYSSAAENVNAYKVEGHRHSAEIEQELGPGALQLPDPPRAARPGDPRQLLPDGARAHEGRGGGALPRGATRTSRSWRWWTRRRTPATCRTPTAAGCT